MLNYLHNIATEIGAIGAGIILIGFFLNQTHKLNQDSLVYDILNLVGSGFLVIYALLLASIPFTALNGIWFVVSLRDIFIDIQKKSKPRP